MKLNPMFSRTLALVAPVTVLTLTHAGGAQPDFFLKIDGIKGESTDTQHKDHIQIESFSWGVSNSSTVTGGGSAGKATFKEFTVTKKTDRSSPPLMLSCAAGTHIPSATFVVRRAAEPGAPPTEGYYVITLNDVLVSSFSTAGNGTDDKPTESVSLNFAKIEFSYRPDDGSEPVVVTFDNSDPAGQ
jgi:type VI secretion system secreted protein Hcp